MSKFKVGDRVTVTIDGCLVASLGDEVTVTRIANDRVHFQTADGIKCWHNERHFELIGGTMNVGDILVNKYGNTRKVLAYLNQGVELFGLSGTDHDYDVFVNFYTKPELDRQGWEPQTEPKATEKTVAEIEQEMNLQPGSLRIKKED